MLMVSKNNGVYTRLEAGIKEIARDVLLEVYFSPGEYKVLVSNKYKPSVFLTHDLDICSV
jgi:hypothetical protein